MADDLKQGLGQCLLHALCQQIPRGDQALCESLWEIDYCFMGLLLQVPGNISHGKPLHCRSLTNVQSPGLRAMLMVQVFNQQCQYQIQIQAMLDGHPRCNRPCASNMHLISSIFTAALILQRRKLWFMRAKCMSSSPHRLVAEPVFEPSAFRCGSNALWTLHSPSFPALRLGDGGAQQETSTPAALPSGQRQAPCSWRAGSSPGEGSHQQQPRSRRCEKGRMWDFQKGACCSESNPTESITRVF